MMIIINLKTNRKTSSSGGDKKRSSALTKNWRPAEARRYHLKLKKVEKEREKERRKTFEDGTWRREAMKIALFGEFINFSIKNYVTP